MTNPDDRTRWATARRAAPHIALFCFTWALTAACIAPAVMTLANGHLGWHAAIGIAIAVALIIVITVVLADDVPEDSKYDA